ncbi:MAG: hypothetical protein WBZ36_06080 [Candidatus Nitrosopolaris sp.]
MSRMRDLSLSCLRKNPAERPKDFHTVLDEIVNIGNEEGVSMQSLVLGTLIWKRYSDLLKNFFTNIRIKTLLKLDT